MLYCYKHGKDFCYEKKNQPRALTTSYIFKSKWILSASKRNQQMSIGLPAPSLSPFSLSFSKSIQKPSRMKICPSKVGSKPDPIYTNLQFCILLIKMRLGLVAIHGGGDREAMDLCFSDARLSKKTPQSSQIMPCGEEHDFSPMLFGFLKSPKSWNKLLDQNKYEHINL